MPGTGEAACFPAKCGSSEEKPVWGGLLFAGIRAIMKLIQGGAKMREEADKREESCSSGGRKDRMLPAFGRFRERLKESRFAGKFFIF